MKLKYYIPVILCFATMHGAAARQDIISVIENKFRDYISSVPREEVYVHTDRDEYISGEDMWFAVYLKNSGNKGSRMSSIAYFEVLNFDNRPVLRSRVLLYGGTGAGHIVLPDSLSSGVYTIRAYTAWMKNFMPENCFLRSFRVWNALSDKDPLRPVVMPGSEPVKALSSPGVALRVIKEPGGVITIDLSGNIAGQKYYYLVETGGIIDATGQLINTGSSVSARMSGSALRRGINHVTIFDSSGKPVAERSVYSPSKDTNGVKVTVPGAAGRRERVEFGVDPGSNAVFSVSVAASGNSGFQGIDEYMVFGSEYGHDIFRSLDPGKTIDEQESLVDSLLDGRGTYRVNWNEVLSGSGRPILYQPEYGIHYLEGSLLNRSTGDQVVMSVPGRNAIFRYAPADSTGRFSFSLPADLAERDIVLQSDNPEGTTIVRLGSPFSGEYPPQGFIKDPSPGPMPEELSIAFQVSEIYGSKSAEKAPSSGILQKEFKRFYGKPDIELVMADYIKLPVMEEVFFELIPGVFMKKKKGGYEINIADPATNAISDSPPALFVDGVIVNSADLIAAIDPEVVEKIDIVKEKYVVGECMFNGIINVITKKADLSDVELPGNALRIRYRSADPADTFIVKSYDSQVSLMARVPDFRNTLLWNPSVNAIGSALLDFTTSDNHNEYTLTLQGVNSAGRFFSSKKTIIVNQNNP